MKYKLRHDDTGDVIEMTLPEIIEEINRDRSELWLDYNESDWQEGLFFTEYTLIEE